MLTNYVKTAWRNLRKNTLNTAINIIGLSIGMACCLLIVLYVVDELGYDRHWPNADRIYRVALERKYPDRVAKYAIIPPSYAAVIKQEIPGVAEAVRLFSFNGRGRATLFKYKGRVFEERNVFAADSGFFRVFQVPMLRGNPNRVLNRPNTIVLTRRAAGRLFGRANPIGQVIEVVQGPKLEVTGICEDLPANGHFTFDFLASAIAPPDAQQPDNYIGFSAATYVLLKPGTQPDAVQAKLPALVEKYAAGPVQRNFGVSYQQYLKAGNGYFYFLQPVPSIHLNSHLEAELGSNGSQTLVTIFSLIAGFVLLIAGINFMNLATARSAERAREVGIRKVLGSTRSQLAAQFLTESVLLSLFSFVVALALVAGFLPFFNNLAGKQLSIQFLLGRWPVLLALVVLIGLLAGSYPSGILSAFEPIKVLKGKFAATRQGHLLRNGLVVFQFAISVILIICTLVVISQLRYIQTKELVFRKEAVVTLQGAGFLANKTTAFKEELRQLAGVETVGATSAIPGEQNYFGVTFRRADQTETVTGRGLVVDDDYLSALGVSMAAGRTFAKTFDDSTSVVLNETAVKELGLTNPIGKQVVSPDNLGQQGGPPVTYTVVGVVKNFHFASLHERVAPLFILHDRWFRRTNNELVIRVKADDPQAVVAQTGAIWKQYLPDQPFHYTFLDADWQALYQSEHVSEQIFGVFSLLAIFIACMGLLGLAIYVIQQRTKEIGVRKVLGASIGGLVVLLAKDFLKLVVVSIVLASPLAWYAMTNWLEGFAYGIAFPWWAFAVAGLLAVGIAFLTVSFQSIKAALMNPVKSLRSE